jgi:predicted short-subunit dehydrogenase-like oxidoreductase (DUF2520 family)
MQKPTVSIIGLGAVGSSLALSLHKAGYRIEGFFVRSPKKAEYLPEKLKKEVYALGAASVINSDLIFICVQDDQISAVVKRLGEMVLSKQPVCIHCSGALPSTALAELEKTGAVGSFHPNKSFSGAPSAQAFSKVYIDIESTSDEAWMVLAEVAENLGGIPFRVNAEQKIRLHTAAAMISNLSVALADAALSLNTDAQSRQALLELMAQTMNEIRTKGTKKSLTGPIARGDIRTIEKHLSVLSEDESLSDIYRSLSRHALEIAGQKGDYPEEQAKQIRKILKK